MSDPHVVSFDQLADADLVVDRVYRGGSAGNASDDPLSKLLPVSNQGGFRTYGRTMQDAVKLVVLYTSGAEPDWPDALDPYTGTFTYFGDNRSPGRELHDTPKKGNLLLSRAFERAHTDRASREQVPPFCYSISPGQAATSDSGACLRQVLTGSVVKRILLPSGVRPEGIGSRITERGSLS